MSSKGKRLNPTDKTKKTVFEILDIFDENEINADETLYILCEMLASSTIAHKRLYDLEIKDFIIEEIERITTKMKVKCEPNTTDPQSL